jgi:hypothetical protein
VKISTSTSSGVTSSRTIPRRCQARTASPIRSPAARDRCSQRAHSSGSRRITRVASRYTLLAFCAAVLLAGATGYLLTAASTEATPVSSADRL